MEVVVDRAVNMDEMSGQQVADSATELVVNVDEMASQQFVDEMAEKEIRYKIPVENNGLARLRRVFTIDKEKEGLTQELYEMILLPIAAFVGGAIYGGLPSARHARHRFIEVSNTQIYAHRVEAVRAAQNAGSRGFIRYGFRWGWRTATVAGGFYFLSTTMSIYRNKCDLLNYAFASGTMGALYRYNLGLRGLIGGAFAGLTVGIPAGLVMLGAHMLGGETNLQRFRRIRIELAEEEWKELEMRKSMTPMMLDYMEDKLIRKNLISKEEEDDATL